MSTVPANLRRYRADLVAAIDRELENARLAPLAPEPRWRTRVQRGVLLVGIAVLGVAVLVLAVAAPWQGSATLVERAEAALLAPAEGEILYESVAVRSRKANFDPSFIRVRVWLDGAPSRGFRMTFSGSRKAEVGGTLGAANGLHYVASDNVLRRRRFPSRVGQSDLDPAAFIKAAIKAGRAKVVGKTRLRGHSVIRFQVGEWFRTTRGIRLYVPIALYYADARTYRPVRVVFTPPWAQHPVVAGPLPPEALRLAPPDALVVRIDSDRGLRFGLPMDPLFFLVDTSANHLPPRAVYDFEEYRLLAPTAANRKLTSVEAVHPQAKMP